MRILVINCGSSTLKFELFEIKQPGGFSELDLVARGLVDRLGGGASFELKSQGNVWKEVLPVADHSEASRLALDRLASMGLLKKDELAAVGHRVIHGADRFGEPVIINEDVIAAIEDLAELAPLHNKPSLNAILSIRKAVGPGIPMVAVFDTAFHRRTKLPTGMPFL
jgi:acetate kinase